MQSLVKRSDFTGRITKWETRLGSFDIQYRPRSLVKGQMLADFIVEFTSIKGSLGRVYNVVARLWKVLVFRPLKTQLD